MALPAKYRKTRANPPDNPKKFCRKPAKRICFWKKVEKKIEKRALTLWRHDIYIFNSQTTKKNIYG